MMTAPLAARPAAAAALVAVSSDTALRFRSSPLSRALRSAPTMTVQSSMTTAATVLTISTGAPRTSAVPDASRVVDISGGRVELGNLTPDREAVSHFGSPSSRAEQMPSGPKMCGDATEGRQEPLGMPDRFKAFHRPFTLSGGLMRVLGSIVQILRLPVGHRGHQLAVSDPVAGQLVGHQHARHIPQALEQLAEESLGCFGVSA